MSHFDLAKIRGERLCFEFPGTESTIKIWADPPTQETLAVAMLEGKVELDMDGNVKTGDGLVGLAVKDAGVRDWLARLSITGVEGLEDWPAECRVPHGSGLEQLSADALKLIPRTVRLIVGQKLREAMEVSEDEGKPSEQPPTGNS
tara:strand:- start:3721 stop:4158 length:438 start_codon:yes stop_codon:yes gene_type:complete